MRPTLSKQKIYDGDELLVDLWNCYVGLSAELRWSFRNILECQAKISRICYVLLVKQFTRKIQT